MGNLSLHSITIPGATPGEALSFSETPDGNHVLCTATVVNPFTRHATQVVVRLTAAQFREVNEQTQEYGAILVSDAPALSPPDDGMKAIAA